MTGYCSYQSTKRTCGHFQCVSVGATRNRRHLLEEHISGNTAQGRFKRSAIRYTILPFGRLVPSNPHERVIGGEVVKALLQEMHSFVCFSFISLSFVLVAYQEVLRASK